ncbi:hypothetical protein EC973_004489 [Apophysomyces ossiformis]|uniref:Uncharacterized protein n=1 Tax=Apophysomyces ossiformis TaxID=679940 RepID=A0A8H7BLA1_9FUNG|nr:hypothetical protein EC973_004489 [Apophysomyces ossiformis]
MAEVNPPPCLSWGLLPIVNHNQIAVCKSHARGDVIPPLPYPGPTLSEPGLNYGERSMPSPIKLMTAMTRRRGLQLGHLGHFGITDAQYDTVRRAWDQLLPYKPLLQRHSEPENIAKMLAYHITTSAVHMFEHGWHHNMIIPVEDVPPAVGDRRLEDLVVSHDGLQSMAYADPSLVALLFPYIYPFCRGHYSIVDRQGADPAEEGGRAHANNYFPTLKIYLKHILMHADRRWEDTMRNHYRRHAIAPPSQQANGR